MKTLTQVISNAHPEFARDLRANVAAAHEQYARPHRPAGPHRSIWWLVIGWWSAPAAWLGHQALRLVSWPRALRRSLADDRLRRERTFWRAIARTTH